MKYQTILHFQKHLQAEPRSRFYLVLVADDFERHRLFEAILSRLPAPIRLNGEETDLKTCLDSMQAMSLFGDAATLIDAVEKMGKKEQQQLGEQLKHASGFVLLGARSKTAVSAVVEKEGIVLDLLEEKPWDRDKRLVEQIKLQAKNRLSSDVAMLLLERLGSDPALIASEVDKLLCYVGDREIITAEDVLRMSPVSRQLTFWQIAENVVWEAGTFGAIDVNAFHGLFPALRAQLHMGMTLATLIEEKRPVEEWSRYLPKVWPKMLEKRSAQAARLGTSFFQKGLELLFEMEVASRTYSTHYQALMDRFRVELYVR